MSETLQPSYTYHGQVISVTDGDTIKVRLDLGFSIDHRVTIRLADVFAAERGQPNASDHTAKLRALLPVGSWVILKTQRLRGAEKQTFGRYVADVWVGGFHVNQKMRDFIGEPQGSGATKRNGA